MGANINPNMTFINGYCRQPGMGGQAGMGQLPVRQMMQMMMQMMQMMMGGMPGMMGGMPGMMGGMPGGFTPMLGDNVGNFLGMPGSVPNGGDPGNGGFPVAPNAQENQDAPHQETQDASAPAQQTPAAPLQQAPAAAQQTPAAPAPPKEQGKTGQAKTGAPPGFKAMKGKVPPEVVAKAKSLLNQPMGTEIPFEINGKNYMARLETHYHPQGYVGGPNGYHKGVTVYEQA